MSKRPVESRDRSGVVAGFGVRRGTTFPPACVKCGRPDGLAASRRRFSYVSPTIYLAFTFGCVGMVLGAVFYLVTRRTMELTVPTCSRCAAAWDRASRRPLLFIAGSFVATLAASALVGKLDTDRIWLPIVGLLVTIIGGMAVHAMGRKATLWANSMDETTATLVGIHPAVIASLEASGVGGKSSD